MGLNLKVVAFEIPVIQLNLIPSMNCSDLLLRDFRESSRQLIVSKHLIRSQKYFQAAFGKLCVNLLNI